MTDDHHGRARRRFLCQLAGVATAVVVAGQTVLDRRAADQMTECVVAVDTAVAADLEAVHRRLDAVGFVRIVVGPVDIGLGGRAAAENITAIAATGISVAIRKGATRPDIS